MNRVELAGTLARIDALRHTPAGIPVLEFGLKHESEAVEAGTPRSVSVEIDAIAFEGQARMLAAAALGSSIRVEGFLSAKGRRSRKIVLHVARVEFVKSSVEGN